MSDFFEDFEGGTDGATITTSNTGFGEVVGGGTGARFSSTHAHSGSLSATAAASTRLRWPYDFDTVTATASAAGDFWYYFTRPGAHTTKIVFVIDASPAVGDLVAAADQVVRLMVDAAGDYRVEYDLDGGDVTVVESTFTGVSADTWLHVEWTFEAGVYELTLHDGAIDHFSTNAGDPTYRTAFAFSEYQVDTDPGCQSWLDDVTVTPLVVTPPVAETFVPATRQFPRDDALGLGSAPRLVPAPRAGRIVGGYM